MSLPAGQGPRALGLWAFVAAILAVVGAISCILGFVRSVRDVERFSAEIGDCVAGAAVEDTRIVACDDPTARRRVVYREIRPSPVTEKVLNETCSGSPTADDVLWKTFEDGQVLILCLETLRP
ncbi:LppU/SCO3897 family protein [Micromonospora sp. DT227]|uniref:LppU/SCO3897 family protein n=1 Tax=Micromonospora sp. DT227 TaxID=3393433 RepID=UPI003CE9F13A